MFKADQVLAIDHMALNLRCPHCGHQGAFTPLTAIKDVQTTGSRPAAEGRIDVAGMRSCPNVQCKGLIFFIKVFGKGNQELKMDIYPKHNANLKTAGVPENIDSAFNEAITCFHYECYRAAGTMLRRTVEELCVEAGADEDKSLHTMLETLRDKHPIISGMVDTLHEVKFLGNDAAHTKLRHFDTIGKEEIEAAIHLLTLILQATYQFEPIKDRLTQLRADK